jgi:hypothetical protein
MTERKKYYEKKFWEKAAPEDATHKHLSRHGVKVAKAKARAAGRPYPNMVDNITAARAGHTKGKGK